jgi:hypothetical protein
MSQLLEMDEPILAARDWGSSGPNNHKMNKMSKHNQCTNKKSDISEYPPRATQETDQSFLLGRPSFTPMRELAQDFQEMPLVEPTNSLLKKMPANGIDGLLLQVANLPGV